MRIVDANVLIYAVNKSDPKHGEARAWLDQALGGSETVGFAWVALLAFIRLSTKVGLFPRPLEVATAVAQVRRWVAQPPGLIVTPTARHLDVLAGLLRDVGTGGNLANDAHLAALAVEHGAIVVTYDSDYGRFAGVEWQPPQPLKTARRPRNR